MTDARAATELGSVEFWSRLSADPKALAVEVCTIDAVDLDRTLYQHPGLRAWINAAYETARTKKARAEWKVTRTKALAFMAAKAQPDPQTGKPKNVDALKAEAELSKEVEIAHVELFAADDECGALKAMSSALEDRLQMLIQIAAKRRQEQRDHQ